MSKRKTKLVVGGLVEVTSNDFGLHSFDIGERVQATNVGNGMNSFKRINGGFKLEQCLSDHEYRVLKEGEK